jgi:hypothetical protein
VTGLSPLEQGLLYLSIAAKAALMLRLLLAKLYSTYRSFFLYLTLDLSESVILAIVPFGTKLYLWVYMVGHGVKVMVAVLVVLELYQVGLAAHPALSGFGRKTVGYVLGAAMVLAACGLRLDSSVPQGQAPSLHYFLSFERTMDAWLLVFLVLISLFMAWFPVRLKRNVLIYLGGFVVYFLARSAGLLLTNMLPINSTGPLSSAMLAVSLCCLLTWLATLRPEGEEATVVVGHRWNPSQMEHLTGQLNAINASLVRLSRP